MIEENFNVGISEEKWIAVQVLIGASGVDVAGGLSLTDASLAEIQVSLLNLSTFGADLLYVRGN